MGTRQRAEEIFLEVIELDTAERSSRLDVRCGSDDALRAEVETLLAADADEVELVDPREVLDEPLRDLIDEIRPGSRVGPYEIVGPIGEGGFGTVYQANQREPIRRSVALKVVKLGMDTHQVIRRFDAERQTLALMDHPHVARVFDAGATESGRPYFAMELVDGEAITSYSDRHRLAVDARIALVLQVCDAVQHAHRRGIIHRDIKPSNVLVAAADGGSMVKIIDFGIARAIELSARDTCFTVSGQFLGTPEYMSPEQASGTGEIDTRTDVYSIGVLLYELLTGSRPFDFSSHRIAAWSEIQRIIGQVEPPQPSRRVAETREADTSALCQLAPPQLTSRLRGDLDWIVMRAMEKEPARRYSGVEALADDLTRHLAGSAVSAAPPSRLYRLRKFVRRRRGLVATAALILITLITGTAGTTWGMWRAQRAERDQLSLRKTAEADRDRSQSVARFLRQTFDHITPEVARGRDNHLLVEMLDGAMKRLEQGDHGIDPGVDLELRLIVGNALIDLARYPDARRMILPALARVNADSQTTPEVRALTFMQAALLADAEGQREPAEVHFRNTLSALRECTAPDPVELAGAHAGLGHVLQGLGRVDEAVEEHRRAVICAQAVGGREALKAQCNLASALKIARRYEEAAAQYAALGQIIDLGSSSLDPLVATVLSGRGALQLSLGNLEEARVDFQRASDVQRAVYGETHPDYALSLNNIAFCLDAMGRPQEAEPLLRASLDIQRQARGEDHAEIAELLIALATVDARLGKLAEAVALCEEAIAMVHRLRGEGHRDAMRPLTTLAECYRRMGRLEDAGAAILRAQQIGESASHPDDEALASCLWISGMVARDQGRLDDAAGSMRRHIVILRSIRGDASASVADPLSQLGFVLVRIQSTDAAREAEPVLREALKLREARLPTGDWRIANTRALLGASLALLAELDSSLPSVDRRAHAQEAEALLVSSLGELRASRQQITPNVRAERISFPARALERLCRAWPVIEPGVNRDADADDWRRQAEQEP